MHLVEAMARRPGRAGALLSVALLPCLLCLVRAQQTFLGEDLPLTVTVTTPVELSDGADTSIQMLRRQTLTAVFSRPVIALGADFGDEQLPANLVPFKLSGCSNLGRLRWVTTSIARWDPRIDWPTDMKCTFSWNKNLKSYDGAPLVVPDKASVDLVTDSMTWSLSSISSEKTENMTDYQWDPNLGLPEDKQPEVPPDANITLSFSYPIQLDLISTALKLTGVSGQTLEVLPCLPPAMILPLAGAKAAEVVRKAPLNCAVVQLKPGLQAGQSAVLTLPKGSKYNAEAGQLGTGLLVKLHGLRSFIIPLRQDFQKMENPSKPSGESLYDVVRYRRLTMWLPHGLASDVTLAAMKEHITICPIRDSKGATLTCKDLPFNLTRPTKGTLMMSVPGIAPLTQYSLKISADAGIKDGWGLPLQASSNVFWTPTLDSVFQGPSVQDQVAVFEPASGTLAWTFVSKGAVSKNNKASSYPVPTSGKALATGLYAASAYFNYLKPDAMGLPAKTLTRSSDTSPQFNSLQLPATAGMDLVTTCCGENWQSGPVPTPAISSSTLVVRTSLQLAIITSTREWTAWVTDTAADSKPVEGATVQIWLSAYAKSASEPGPKCVTGKSGTCTLTNSDMVDESRGWFQWSALVTPPADGKQGALVVRDVARISTRFEGSGNRLQAKLVLDRQLTKPTQKLYAKAYVLRQDGTSLKLPDKLDKATWVVYPNFDPSNASPYTQEAVSFNSKFGTLEAAIDIPEGAKFGEYRLALRVSDPPTGGDVDIASESFLVADPRPPTAELTLTAPSWVKPRDTVKVEIEAMSYLGSAVSDAEIDIKWSTSKATGTAKPKTDLAGKATLTIPLGSRPENQISQAGDTLTIDASWVGPTRELINATKTVKVEDGPIKVSLERTLVTDLPGVPFGVVAKATKNEDDKPQDGLDVNVALVAAPGTTLPDGCAALAAAQKCTIKSGVAAASKCQLSLPCKAEFRLQGCVSSSGGNSCSGELLLGRNSTWWSNAPWSNQPSLTPLLDAEEYDIGDEVGLQVQNPFWGSPTSGLAIWGNTLARKTKYFDKIDSGTSTLKVGPIGQECRGGCTLVLVLSVSRPDTSPKNLPDVRTSALFDPLAPHSESITLTIKVKQDDALKVSITGTQGSGPKDKLVVAPESSSSITVKVLRPDGKSAAAGAQVTLVGVDEALLDLKPYPLQDVNAALQPALGEAINVQEFNRLRVAPKALNITFSVLQRRLQLDPFLPTDTTVQPSSGYPQPRLWGRTVDSLPSVSAVDTPDDIYLASYSSAVTPVPSPPFCILGRACPVYGSPVYMMRGNMVRSNSMVAAGPMPVAMAMKAAPMAADAAGGAAAAESATDNGSPAGGQGGGAGVSAPAEDPTRRQEEFNTTPVWASATTAADGSVTFKFKAPVNLGSFVIRAYAVDPASGDVPEGGRQASYGGAESSLIVRRPVSLEASVPRIVRVGDTFEAGVLVTGSLGTSSVSVVTSVALGDKARPAPLQLTGPATITASLSGELQQREVRFAFMAVAIGNATLTFKVTTPSGGDSLEWSLPVLGKQGEVFVATSFAVKPVNGSTTGRGEGMALPNAIPGSGNLQMVAGVGFLPSIQAMFVQLVNQDTRDYPEASQSLALGLMPAYLGPYRPAKKPLNDWLVSTQISAALQGLEDVAGPLTDDAFGLLYTDPRRGFGWTPTSCDIRLNAWATWLVESNSGDAKAINDAGYGAKWGAVMGKVTVWKSALESQLVRDAIASRQPPFGGQGYAYPDMDTLSWARLVLGAGWSPKSAPAEVVEDLSMKRLVGGSVNLTAGAQARVGLILVAQGGQAAEVGTIVKRLLSRVRVGGRTAYVAAGDGERGAAGLGDQALVLGLFLATKTDNPLVEKLAAYIAAGNPVNRFAQLVVSVGGWSAALAGNALRDYDAATSSTNPDLTLRARAVQNNTVVPLLIYTFNSSNSGALVRSKPKPWSEIPSNSQLQVTATGSGQASVAASLNFIPAELLLFPSYRGLWVQRVLQRSDTPSGSLSAVPLKTMTTTVVQVTTPDDMSKVVVEVMMPGGLEPLDPLVYPDPDLATICKESEDEEDIAAPNGGGGGGPVFIEGDMAMPMVSAKPMAASRLAASSMAFMPMSDYAVASPAIARGGYSPWFWPPWPMCPEQVTQPSVVTFTFAFMRAGTHTIRFQSIAATPGAFVLPPVKAYVAEQPEIMGLSAAGAFKVCPTADKCEGEVKPLPPPKSCPRDCSDNGSCNLATGKCLCNTGFSGDDCGKFSSQ